MVGYMLLYRTRDMRTRTRAGGNLDVGLDNTMDQHTPLLRATKCTAPSRAATAAKRAYSPWCPSRGRTCRLVLNRGQLGS